MKSLYTLYKERLIEISGRNRSLYLRTFNKKNGYDIGKILVEGPEKAEAFLDLIWNGKTTPIKLISKETEQIILKSSGLDEKFPMDKTFENLKDRQKYLRQRSNLSKRIIAQEVRNINALKREIEEIEKETGRYELYLCYPFVYGAIKNFTFKAPLLLFPVQIEPIDDYNVNISLTKGTNVQLNKALILAIAEAHHLNIEGLETEFPQINKQFADIQAVLDYLRTFGIKISYQPRKNIFAFDRYEEPSTDDGLQIRQVCLLSRYALANSIYNDYSILEKKHLTNNSINELLNTKPTKICKAKNEKLYLINDIDFAQREVISKVNDNGNMVIYGPPGTGKSQTIVNVVSDAISKGKRVLVISQKKAALEVIFNRLASLNNKAVFIVDAEKERRNFYSRCFSMHENVLHQNFVSNLFEQYDTEKAKLDREIENLERLSRCLNDKTEFGISLADMYYNSYKIGQNTIEYEIYKDMLEDKKLMALKYDQLNDALINLTKQNTATVYYNFVKNSIKNPFIQYLRDDLNIHIVSKTLNKLNELIGKNLPVFDTARYRYARQVLSFMSFDSDKNYRPLLRMLAKLDDANTFEKRRKLKEDVDTTLEKIRHYISAYDFIKDVLVKDGYYMAVDAIMNANDNIFNLLREALTDYIDYRDTQKLLQNLSEPERIILNFAYSNSQSLVYFQNVISKLLKIRLYHEIVVCEEIQKDTLSSIADFENIRARISMHKSKLNDISRQIAEQSFVKEYKQMLNGSVESKDYIYQISKKQKYWPVRKLLEVYGEYLFKLFPCWLLSPENVSTLLPLEQNLFDVVLFDEASQVFIENSIPSIYRGKSVVVAGDSKQLRPTTTFMRRYMGNTDDEEDLDYSTQAALEVESLLDLAIARFNSANITYHYRSQNEELIDFSNMAFYEGKLQIAPNITKNVRHKPIERIMVNGLWEDGKNTVEAEKIVSLLRTILKNRKNNETIGVITFNSEQEAYIEDLIDKQCKVDDEFRKLYLQETNRVENGQDVSLFVRNLENVQGDERDIIIFSIGYAKNEMGKVNYIFGTLSYDGGENRLNVAITRAKKKIYVVTSIEPEELKVDTSKSKGPKLLRSYLTYVRAVSNGNHAEVRTILNGLGGIKFELQEKAGELTLEQEIASELNKLGYTTELNLGFSNANIAIAVYDKRHDKYLLGIEIDSSVAKSSISSLERDVFRNEFLHAKGWKLIRVWAREWWHNKKGVISNIVKLLQKQEGVEVETDVKKKVKVQAAKVKKQKNSKQIDFFESVDKKVETKKVETKKAGKKSK